MATNYSITTDKNVNPKEHLKLSLLLRVINTKLDDNWQLTDNNDANVIIIDVDNKTSTHHYQNSHAFPIYFSETKTDNPWCLAKPIRHGDLLELLQKVSEHFAKNSSKKTKAFVSKQARLNLEQKLLGQLLQHIIQHAGKKFVVSCQNVQLYIDTKKQRCYCADNLDLFTPIFRLNTVNANFSIMQPFEWQKVTENLPSYSLDSLLWQMALSGSQGQLLDEYTIDQVFQLKQWPDFANLPYDYAMIKILYYLFHYPCSIRELVDITKIAQTEIIDFINACAILGLLHQKPSAKQYLPILLSKASPMRSLVSKIVSRLKNPEKQAKESQASKQNQEVKIVFAGSPCAGKTTAIAQISEIPPVTTEALGTDELKQRKQTTTVAMDYGEFILEDGQSIHIYGTPGQQRFQHMWHILVKGALGLIILVDDSSQEAEQDIHLYLDEFADYIKDNGAVVGITHTDETGNTLEKYLDVLHEKHLYLPMFAVDVRERDHVVMMVEVMLSRLELDLTKLAE